MTHRRLGTIALVLALALAGGCGDDGGLDPNDPDNPNALGLAVGVRVDPATFPTTGEFILELVPSTAQGQSLVTEAWETTAGLGAPAAVVATLLSQELSTPDTRPFSVALDIDNTGSMSRNDPDAQRLDAAGMFAQAFIPQTAGNRLSLFEIGPTTTTVPPETPGFPGSRFVTDWTASAAAIEAAAGALSAYPDAVGGSRIYRSIEEITDWIDSTTSAVDERRAIIVLTDGRPSDEDLREGVFANALAAQVRVYTVGIGPGSDRGGDTDPVAVQELQLIANRTGGLYVGAATPERIAALLEAFATSTSQGVILARFRLDPIPAPGLTVSGTVRMENDRGVAQAPWSFVAP